MAKTPYMRSVPIFNFRRDAFQNIYEMMSHSQSVCNFRIFEKIFFLDVVFS